MFEIGWSELLVIAVVAIVVIGPKDLPKAMRAVGGWTAKMKRMAREFQGQFNEALREAESQAEGDEHERLYRLRKECEAGVADQELSERKDELENAILAERVTFKDEEMPLRTAQAKLAVLAGYREREELGDLQADASAGFNDARRDLLRDEDSLAADLSGIADPVERNEEEKGISIRALAERLRQASEDSAGAFATLRDRWFDEILGP